MPEVPRQEVRAPTFCLRSLRQRIFDIGISHPGSLRILRRSPRPWRLLARRYELVHPKLRVPTAERCGMPLFFWYARLRFWLPAK